MDNPHSNKKSIYLAVLNQGWLRTEMIMFLLHLRENSPYSIYITFPAEKPIDHNRNNIVKKFLKTDFDYLMMLDGDIIPPTNILNLVDYDKDIIGGLAFAYKQNRPIPLMLQKKENDDGSQAKWKYRTAEVKDVVEGGLQETDAIGTGCMIISRRVLEHAEMKPAFVNYYDDEGLRIEGLDLSFCRRAQELGFKIYCHLDYPCSHFCDQDLKEIYKGRNQLK